MKIQVRVKPQAKTTAVEQQADGSWIVKVKASAQEGKANEAVIGAVAKHFGFPKTSVKIIRGLSSRIKLLELPS